LIIDIYTNIVYNKKVTRKSILSAEKGVFMKENQHGDRCDNSLTEREKEAFRRHYDYYKSLADNNTLNEQDIPQWDLAQERKNQGLIE
jgi:hypothetical protein